MPQVHFVATRELALKTARDKILQAPDDASAIVSGHLVVEALLYAFVRSWFPHRGALEAANLRFHQTMCIARALRRKLKREEWLWATLDQLNRIRNRLSHDIHVQDFLVSLQQLYAAAGPHIDIHARGADSIKREDYKLKFFLLILCGVVHSLQREKTGNVSRNRYLM